MIDLGLSKEVSRIWLEVRVSGSTARRFYEKSGFVESGRRKNYYSNPPEDAVIMSLRLTGAAKKNIPGDKTTEGSS
jgi:ribosomal-protein-alanine N-acetyltransferase